MSIIKPIIPFPQAYLSRLAGNVILRQGKLNKERALRTEAQGPNSKGPKLKGVP